MTSYFFLCIKIKSDNRNPVLDFPTIFSHCLVSLLNKLSCGLKKDPCFNRNKHGILDLLLLCLLTRSTDFWWLSFLLDCDDLHHSWRWRGYARQHLQLWVHAYRLKSKQFIVNAANCNSRASFESWRDLNGAQQHKTDTWGQLFRGTLTQS